jgi:hydroxymethylbilane synthase
LIDTVGDRDKKTPISEMEGTDFFTRDIDVALLEKKIDCAVHSAKDLPEEVPAGLEIAVMTSSFEPAEALVSKDGLRLSELPSGARTGVSSQRRKEQIKRLRPDLQTADIRGTIEERLKQLEEGKYDAVIIAAVALLRLGFENHMTEKLDTSIFPPHPLQGRLAVLVRKGDPLGGVFSRLAGEAAYV